VADDPPADPQGGSTRWYGIIDRVVSAVLAGIVMLVVTNLSTQAQRRIDATSENIAEVRARVAALEGDLASVRAKLDFVELLTEDLRRSRERDD